MPGKTWAQTKPHSPELLRSLGRVCGRLSYALQNFDHPGAHTFLKWDPQHAEWIAPHISKLFGKENEQEKKGILEWGLNVFREKVIPLQNSLRKSVNHNDANDHNIVVQQVGTTNEVQCMVDYGDAVYTYTVNELAIALAYAAMDKADPIAAACEVVRAYHQEFPLLPEECEVLFPLMLARLMISVVCSAQNIQEHPENTYLQVSDQQAWSLLRKLHSYSACFCPFPISGSM